MPVRAIRHPLLAFVAISIALCSVRSSAGPAAKPSLSELINQLADRDPAARDAAEQRLMELSAADLPTLEQTVKGVAPLRPGQGELLREIITQVFLSGESFKSNPAQGFIGVKMKVDFDSVHSEDDSNPELPLGVTVESRLPGFSAYALLRDGDVILTIAAAGLPDGADADHRVRTSMEVASIIRSLPAGRTIDITLLRAGRHAQVSIVLVPHPVDVDDLSKLERFREDRAQRAEAFWAEHFARFIDAVVS
ncbi:MAG: hypothetical protein JO353_05855 [Phycisphaerae bacterium]|nr:hypothetical protein [Phycisphaerae bacterium]